MYSVPAYGKMIADVPRMEAYARALREAVRPGAVVLDIGTGTGVMALLACRFGAERVYAVEPDGVIQVARETAAANGYADRIEFLQELSTRVELPRRADVVVSDLRGVLPLLKHHVPSIVDARTRLLAPGGVLIPRRDTLWAAVAEAPEEYAGYAGPWESGLHGLDLRAGKRVATNSWGKARLRAEQLLTRPGCWAELDYTTIEDPGVAGEVLLAVERDGVGHGVCAWFDAELAPGVGFSNAPGEPELIYGQGFFPWTEPVPLRAGDTVRLSLRADRVGDDYTWSWATEVAGGRAAFRQSTFLGAPLSPEWLRKGADGFVPRLGAEGEADRALLERMDGTRTLGEIAREVAARFPGRFPAWEAALARAGELSRKYGE